MVNEYNNMLSAIILIVISRLWHGINDVCQQWEGQQNRPDHAYKMATRWLYLPTSTIGISINNYPAQIVQQLHYFKLLKEFHIICWEQGTARLDTHCESEKEWRKDKEWVERNSMTSSSMKRFQPPEYWGIHSIQYQSKTSFGHV